MTENIYLPRTGGDLGFAGFSAEKQPGRTWRLDIEHGRTTGLTDGADALRQAIYLILNVERYRYPIYSYGYGVELSDLFGKSRDYVMSEVKRRITEALTQDDRVTGVDGWRFEADKKSVIVTFTVHSIYGDIESTKEVVI